jgi:hypothetical protein
MVLYRKFSAFTLGAISIASSVHVAEFETREFVKYRRVCFLGAVVEAMTVTFEGDASKRQAARREALV